MNEMIFDMCLGCGLSFGSVNPNALYCAPCEAANKLTVHKMGYDDHKYLVSGPGVHVLVVYMGALEADGRRSPITRVNGKGARVYRMEIDRAVDNYVQMLAALLERPDPDLVEAARRGGTSTHWLRDDETWLAELMLKTFGPGGRLPDKAAALVELETAYPFVLFEPTDECWAAAVAIFEAHLNDEAREIADSIDPEIEGSVES